MFDKRKITVIGLALSLAMFAAGCKKKVPPPPPPPPPAAAPAPAPAPTPAAPRVSQFSAEPTSILRGQSAMLRWEVTGATAVSIDQSIGTVQSAGSRSVSPDNSTTYTLTATGPGGSISSSVTVAVTTPPPPPPPPAAAPRATIEQRLMTDVQDVYYDYDKSDVRSDARDVLARNAAALKAILADFPGATIVVEGHADERGSAEYNLGLGDQRAGSAKEYLVQLGVAADRLRPISYGKERPQCTSADEACYQKNRRAHFTAGQ